MGVVAPEVGVALLEVAKLWTTKRTGSVAFLMALTATVWSELRSWTPLISISRSPVKSWRVRPAGESGRTCFTKMPEIPEPLWLGVSHSTWEEGGFIGCWTSIAFFLYMFYFSSHDRDSQSLSRWPVNEDDSGRPPVLGLGNEVIGAATGGESHARRRSSMRGT